MRIDGSLRDGGAFARIISLGANCEPAAHLRRAGYYQTKSPFDWLVTPMRSLSAILADRGALLGTQFISANSGTSTACGAYGVLYHHEFPRAADERVRFTAAAIADCRGKLLHKMATFWRGCSAPGRVLFLRQYLATALPWDNAASASVEDAAKMVDDLVGQIETVFSDLDFHVLLILPEASRHKIPQQRRVSTVTLPRNPEPGWDFADDTWDELLRLIPYATSHAEAGETEVLFGM